VPRVAITIRVTAAYTMYSRDCNLESAILYHVVNRVINECLRVLASNAYCVAVHELTINQILIKQIHRLVNIMLASRQMNLVLGIA
jgi:hypothetical protein